MATLEREAEKVHVQDPSWRKVAAGEYESSDGRWHVVSTGVDEPGTWSLFERTDEGERWLDCFDFYRDARAAVTARLLREAKPHVTFTIERDDIRNEYVHNVRLRLMRDGDNVADVMVYGPHEKYGTPTGSEVNWQALGSVDAETADAFATVLQMAVHVASELDAMHGIEEG